MKTISRILTVAGVLLLAATQVSAQIGRRFPSERKVMTDPVTGAELIFLTSQEGMGDSKIYQTHNQWTSDLQWVIFRSNRAGGDVLAVNEYTGEMVQVTEGGYSGMICVARNSMKMYIMRAYMTEEQKAAEEARKANPQAQNQPRPSYPQQIIEMDLEKIFADSAAGAMKDVSAYERVCGIVPADMYAGSNMGLDATEKIMYFNVGTEYAKQFPIPSGVEFKKLPAGSRGTSITGLGKMNLETGKCEHVVTVPFSIGHVQGNPWHENEVLFCWETGGKAPQRTWVCDGDGSNLRPVYRELDTDWVTHEAVMTGDKVAIAVLGHRLISEDQKAIDNSGDATNPGQEDRWGYCGTREYAGGLGIVNLRTREFTLAGQTKEGSGFWHVAGSNDGNFVAGDDFYRDLYIIDCNTFEQRLLTTGHPMTARDHPHPTFKPDNTEIEIQTAMLSADKRSLNICIVKIPDDMLFKYRK